MLARASSANAPRTAVSGLCVFAFTILIVCLSVPAGAQTVPNAPTNLAVAAVSATQINVSWSDNSTNEDGFKIERSLDGISFTQIAQVLPNTTSYRNAGLFPGTTYYYRVRAHNSGGDSAFSNVASAGTSTLCPTTVMGWGDNSNGQTTIPSGLTNVVAIAAGGWHNLALRGDGTVVGWGADWYGQATPPAAATGVVAIAGGYYHSLALKGDGTVVGWGGNDDWSGTYRGQATPPPGLTGVVAIAAGWIHSLALKSDGSVIGWGDNFDYNGTYQGQATPPPGLTGVVAIAAGGWHSLALKSDGTVVAWGLSVNGQTAVPPVRNVVAIAGGGYDSLALLSDGTVLGWGYNGAPPTAMTGGVAVAAGYAHNLVLNNGGTVVAWGYYDYGQATPPLGLTVAVAIGAGVLHSLAVSSVPSTPSSLAATAVSANQVNVSWTPIAGVLDGFRIERAPDAGGSAGTWTQIVAVAANITSYTDTGLTTNTTYWYRMRSYNACTNSPYTVAVSITTAPPPAPLNLTAFVADTNQVSLSWNNNYRDVAGFKVDRALDNGGSPGTWAQVATVGGNNSTYTDTGLAPNTTYWYRIRTYNALGDSPYSNLACATLSGGQLITVMQWNIEGHIGNILSNNTAEAKAIARIINYNRPDVLLF